MRASSAAGLAAAAVLVASPTDIAAAQTRGDTRAMACAEAQALVRSEGDVVLTTGRLTFARFVASRRYCLPGEMTVPALAQTADRERCRLGYHCVIRDARDAR